MTTKTRRPQTFETVGYWEAETSTRLETPVWLVDEKVAGFVTKRDVHMSVGNGTAIHAGVVETVTVTVAYERIDKYGRVKSVAVGDTFDLEPSQYCGTTAYAKSRGYSTGFRYKNLIVEGETTCQKCKKSGR